MGESLGGCRRAVGEPLAVLEIEVGKRHVAIVFNRQLITLQWIAETQIVEVERVRLIIEPVERDLDRVVQTREPHRFAHEQAPPNTRLAAHHRKAQREHAFRRLLDLRAFAFVQRNHELPTKTHAHARSKSRVRHLRRATSDLSRALQHSP